MANACTIPDPHSDLECSQHGGHVPGGSLAPAFLLNLISAPFGCLTSWKVLAAHWDFLHRFDWQTCLPTRANCRATCATGPLHAAMSPSSWRAASSPSCRRGVSQHIVSKSNASAFWPPLCLDCQRPWVGLAHLECCILLMACRFGEASHPGPDTIALGCLNPTGLNGKYAVASALEPGIYGVSESHLTQSGIQRFRQGSRSVGSPFSLHHGAPVNARPGSAYSGEYSGVGFLSSCPARAAPCDWPEGLQETGRVHVVNFFLQPLWLLGGVAYGFPTCPHRTAFLLDALTQRVVIEGQGPRFLCGDYNLEPQHVPQAAFWRSRGFIEIQDLHFRLAGKPPAPTCKSKTRKDFCWISPEIQALFVETVVDETLFADHAGLFARLRKPLQSVPRFVWRMPCPITQDMVPTGPLADGRCGPLPAVSHDPDAFCKGIFAQYEQRVSDHLVAKGREPLSRAFRGRSCTMDVTVTRAAQAPVHRGRNNEVSPACIHPSLPYAQRFRQLRRFQALVQNLQKGSVHPAALEYRAGLWSSILASTGFLPSFTLWWPQRPVKLVGDPDAVPLEPPTLQQARAYFASLEANIRSLERQRSQRYRKEAKAARMTDPTLIFSDLREPLPQSVETLLEVSEAVVEDVDREDFSVALSHAVPWRPELPLLTKEGPCHIIHAEPDKVWCSSLPQISPGDKVRQERYLGSLPDIFRAFGDAWSARWLKHENIPSDRWDAVLEAVPQLPPGNCMQLQPISLSAWRQAVRAKHPRTSSGPDGISRLDLLAMPDDLTMLVLDICHHAEATGRWPQSALQGVVTAVQKAHTSAAVGDFRPITIFSLIYRCWSSLRARQCLPPPPVVFWATDLGFLPPACGTPFKPRSRLTHWTVPPDAGSLLTLSRPLTASSAQISDTCMGRSPDRNHTPL